MGVSPAQNILLTTPPAPGAGWWRDVLQQLTRSGNKQGTSFLKRRWRWRWQQAPGKRAGAGGWEGVAAARSPRAACSAARPLSRAAGAGLTPMGGSSTAARRSNRGPAPALPSSAGGPFREQRVSRSFLGVNALELWNDWHRPLPHPPRLPVFRSTILQVWYMLLRNRPQCLGRAKYT